MWVRAYINGIEVRVREEDVIEIDEKGNIYVNGELLEKIYA